MKKLIPTLAILGSAVAFAIYKLKKDEQKQLMELDQDLLVDDNDDTDEIIHLKPKQDTKSKPVIEKEQPKQPEAVVAEPKKEKRELTPEAQAFVTPKKEIAEPKLPPLPKVEKPEPVKEPEEVNEAVYHEEKLAEALQSLKDQVEEPDNKDEIRQAIKEAISEGQPELPETEIKEETPFAYTAPAEEAPAAEEEEEDEYNEEYPHLTNTLVDDINQMTQEAMDSLASDGDVHEHERPVQHMVSFSSMADLDNFKNKVINKGFVITKGEGDMDLVVLHISPIDKVKLVSNILYLADQAYANNGEYKGWQSKVSY